jgi:hypothetical protein
LLVLLAFLLKKTVEELVKKEYNLRMKALSIKQPFARLIETGIKTVECRSWQTKYRGKLIICASRNPLFPGLSSGVTICTINLIDCRPFFDADIESACLEFLPIDHFAWVLRNPEPVKRIEIKGQLGIFNLPSIRL